MVRMTHPDAGDYDAQPSQVPHLKLAGWTVAPGQSEQGEVWPSDAGLEEEEPQVTLWHPGLDREQTFPASAEAHWRGLGWLRPGVDELQPPPEPAVPDDLDALTVADLQDVLRARGLAVSGSKAELVERIRAGTEAAEQPQESEE